MKVKLETSHGDMVIELEQEKAPATVANFLAYVDEGFYDGTIFHRVMYEFMIQGGGFEPGMNQKPTLFGPVENEADNGLSNEVGTVAMARTPDPHSATAQFFINSSDNTFLDFKDKSQQGWGYCVFGRVVEGADVATEIEKVSTGSRGQHQNVPDEDVVIVKVSRFN